jgi:hypothetical protein
MVYLRHYGIECSKQTMTENNWFQTNLADRKEGLCEFKVQINPYEFTTTNFMENSKRLAYKLINKHNKLYVAYSGGLDSEFVLKTFVENNLPITPVLISSPFNQIELKYALDFCDQLNVKPEIISFTCNEFIDQLHNKTHKRNMFALLGGLPLILADMIDGKLITGYGEPFWTVRHHERMVDCKDYPNLEFCEWDFYLNCYDDTHPSGFFTYDISVFYSMIKEADYNLSFNNAKVKLYNLKPRPKMFWRQDFQNISWELNKEKHPGKFMDYVNKNELIKTFEEYIK